MEDEGDDDVNEEELKEVKEDAIVSSSEFRQWKALSKANAILQELLSEIVALASSDSDEDEDYEEIEDDGMAV